MKCFVYKGARQPDTYLFVERARDFSRVPKSLLTLMGSLNNVLKLELTPDLTLVRSQPKEIMRQLKDQGFYLQLPDRIGRIGNN